METLCFSKNFTFIVWKNCSRSNFKWFLRLLLCLYTQNNEILKTFDHLKLIHKIYDNLQKSVFTKNSTISKMFEILNSKFDTKFLQGVIFFCVYLRYKQPNCDCRFFSIYHVSKIFGLQDIGFWVSLIWEVSDCELVPLRSELFTSVYRNFWFLHDIPKINDLRPNSCWKSLILKLFSTALLALKWKMKKKSLGHLTFFFNYWITSFITQLVKKHCQAKLMQII